MRYRGLGIRAGGSFAHGTNDGQKSIGLIMIIGMFPATYALNSTSHLSLKDISSLMQQAAPLIQRYGDDQKDAGLAAAGWIERQSGSVEGSAVQKLAKELGGGERLGNIHLTPAQGASAEVVSALLIGTAGFTGLPVSTTHIVTSGIAGTMVASGAGLKYGMISRIAIAWLITLPVTISIAGGLYYLLANPQL
jgi:PiT family inorganic phosphate transporter